MKFRKEQLRQSARIALAEEGFTDVQITTGPGIITGARLRAMKNGKSYRIAVRTSSDREVGLLRRASGRWRTVENVDLVVVSVPMEDAPAVEVFGFDPGVLIEAFKVMVKVTERGNRDRSRFKVPVFMSLDDYKGSKRKPAHAFSLCRIAD